MKITYKKFSYGLLVFLILPIFFYADDAKHSTALIVIGEQSGEDLARWYLQKKSIAEKYVVTGLCSNTLAKELAVTRLEGFDDLKKVSLMNKGIGSLCKELICQHSLFNKFYDRIAAQHFDLVVLVDFPWVNLRLARALKQLPNCPHIVFIAPPELWFWGRWGIDKLLKNYCDETIVLYPHEQEWYNNIGLKTSWLGYPHLDAFKDFIKNPRTPTAQLALFPGSRDSEVEKSMPFLCETIQKILATTPSDLKVIIVRAASITSSTLEKYLTEFEITAQTEIIEHDDYERIAQSFYALTKPGTVTLNLALLGVPHALFFRTSWFNDKFLSWVIRPSSLSLPNLLSQQKIIPEFTQEQATPDTLADHVSALHASFLAHSPRYKNQQAAIRKFSAHFLDDRENPPS